LKNVASSLSGQSGARPPHSKELELIRYFNSIKLAFTSIL
jgi:hypothetical protein